MHDIGMNKSLSWHKKEPVWTLRIGGFYDVHWPWTDDIFVSDSLESGKPKTTWNEVEVVVNSQPVLMTTTQLWSNAPSSISSCQWQNTSTCWVMTSNRTKNYVCMYWFLLHMEITWNTFRKLRIILHRKQSRFVHYAAFKDRHTKHLHTNWT